MTNTNQITMEELIRAGGGDPGLVKFGRLVGRDLPPDPLKMTMAEFQRAAIGGRALDASDTLMCGLEQQFERMCAPRPPDPELRDLLAQMADAELSLGLLLRLRRAAVLMRKHVDGGSALEGAIADFDAAVPDLKHLRDTDEHFDDYILGRGRHKPGQGIGRSYYIKEGVPPVVSRGDKSVDLGVAIHKARELYVRMYEATVGHRPYLLREMKASSA